MNRLSTFAAASCLGLASLMVMPNALADQWNKKTILTVNEPIQVPGKVLQPGKYVIKLLDSPSNRHIVQIFNDRESQIQTTVLAIPNYRLQPTGKTEFQWWETPAGQPKALRAWFYPGDNFGQEFAYPKNEAMQIASVTNQSVPTTTATTQEEMQSAEVNRVDQSGNMTQDNNQQQQQAEVTPAPAPAPAPEAAPAPQQNVEMAQNTPPPAPAPTALPRTASPLPLIGFAGLLALSLAIGVRALASRLS
jgi:hypothetical protein